MNGVVKEQYDFDAWKHVEAVKPLFRQKSKLTGNGMTETFEWYPGRLDEIFTVVLVKVPNQDYHLCQTDFFPELKDLEDATDGDGKPSVYFKPDPQEFIIPPRMNYRQTAEEMLWTTKDPKRQYWTRADGKEWSCLLMTRKLAKTSNRYLRAHVLTPSLLAQTDPNNQDWKTRSNKYWRQLIRRDTDSILTQKLHWIAEEMNVILVYINSWCYIKGVDAFRDTCFSAAENAELTEKVNAIRNEGRQPSSISGWIHNQIKAKRYRLDELCEGAARIRQRIEGGEDVKKSERHPEEALALIQIDDEDRSAGKRSKRKVADRESDLEADEDRNTQM
ncbi:hypothetical protein NX059_008135 [Plenodomus lindquistii]|nr:hypothetical protein NX059_008135 [Plenodomus lindquistii]